MRKIDVEKVIDRTEPTEENLSYLESMINQAKKVLLNHNSPASVNLTLIKNFYYFAGKEWWKDYLSKHNDIIVIFLDTESGEKYKLGADGEIYLYNIFEVK